MLIIQGVLVILVLAAAIAAVEMKDPLAAVICFSIMGSLLAVVYAVLRAPDVAIAEAAIGAGLLTAFFMVTINKIQQNLKR